MMNRRTALRSALSLPVALALPPLAQAQASASYPVRPVHIIVPFGPGGAADFLPRMVGEKLAATWGQAVVVENKAGAAGNIGMSMGVRAAPDGYTLLSAPVGNLAINPHLYPNLGFDVRKDLSLITLVGAVENVLVANTATGLKTLPELLARAKAQPGKVTFASGGVGTQAHMGGELINAMAGVNMLHVAYKGVGDAVRDLLGGFVDVMVAQLPSVLPHIQSGRLQALGLASARPSDLLPGVPTVAAAGNLPGFEALSWYALVGPAGLPEAIVAQIQRDVAVALRSPDLEQKFRAQGMRAIGSTPQELATALNADYERYGALVRKLGIEPR
jgi:tripartite-type tricarboxylate transporter receptor subunit TctC